MQFMHVYLLKQTFVLCFNIATFCEYQLFIKTSLSCAGDVYMHMSHWCGIDTCMFQFLA